MIGSQSAAGAFALVVRREIFPPCLIVNSVGTLSESRKLLPGNRVFRNLTGLHLKVVYVIIQLNNPRGEFAPHEVRNTGIEVMQRHSSVAALFSFLDDSPG